MSKNTQLPYYQKDRDTILNGAENYWKNNSDKIKKQARDNFNIAEEKIEKIEYEKTKYHNMTGEKRNKKNRIWEK